MMPTQKVTLSFEQPMDPSMGQPAIELVEDLMPTEKGYTFFPRFGAIGANDVIIANSTDGSSSAFAALIPATPSGALSPTDQINKLFIIAGEDAPTLGGATSKLQATAMEEGTGSSYSHTTTSTNNLGMWDFCQFGTQVIATCYVDPVKVINLNDGTPAWANLITSTQTPKARFCDIIGQRLVLAKIDNTGGNPNGVFPNMIWWSAVDDIDNFNIPSSNYGGYYTLDRTPGVITGFIGGDYGLVFKANEVWRLDFVGLPETFKLNRLSNQVGTIYPRSIVRVGDNVYFWSAEGVQVTNGSQVARAPGFERIKSLIFGMQPQVASGFHRLRKWPTASTYSSTTDAVDNLGVLGQFVQGAYDILSENIFWIYYPSSGQQRILAYHVPSGKFGIIDNIYMTTGTLNGLIQLPPLYGYSSINTEYLDRDRPSIAGNVFSSDVVYAAPFENDDFTLSAVLRTGPFRLSEDHTCQIDRVRLLFTTQEGQYGVAATGTLFTYTAQIEYDHSPHFPDATSETIASSTQNEEEEIIFTKANGAWFRLTITFTTQNTVPANLIGLEVFFHEEGIYA